jgi:hypothetical protein
LLDGLLSLIFGSVMAVLFLFEHLLANLAFIFHSVTEELGFVFLRIKLNPLGVFFPFLVLILLPWLVGLVLLEAFVAGLLLELHHVDLLKLLGRLVERHRRRLRENLEYRDIVRVKQGEVYLGLLGESAEQLSLSVDFPVVVLPERLLLGRF